MTRRLRIIDKGLLVILLPVLYQAILLGVLMQRQQEHTLAQSWAMHSKDVLLQVDRIYTQLVESQSALRGYALSQAPEAANNAKTAVAQISPALSHLHDSVSDNPRQQQKLARLIEVVNARLEWHGQIFELIKSGDRAAAIEKFQTMEGQITMEPVRHLIDEFRDTEIQLDAERLEALKRSTAQQRWLLVGGLALNVAIGGIAVVIFGRNITRRIAVLIQNAQRLTRGETLVPPVKGSDELADLDRSFHSMASSLLQSNRKEAEFKGKLEKQNAELTRANRELDQKNKENEMFVYSVSHDLRSPLVNLQGFSKELSLLRDDLRAIVEGSFDDGARQRARTIVDRDMPESIHYIQTAVTRLSSIIDALLRLSRAGRIEYRAETVELSTVFRRIVEAMRGSIAQKKAEVILGPLPAVWGDPTALEQIFANLLGNAVNYLDSNRPGRIEAGLGASANPDLAGFQVIFVKDNGMGIAEAHLPKVFAIFQRLHPKAAAGEGVGLALVRRMVERHGGTIWVESEPGVGSTFFVALPAKSETPLEVAVEKESTTVTGPTS